MVKSGAKGSVDNMCSMIVTLGHQKISNVPIHDGLCKSSHSDGLTNTEFFYHMMSSREGVTHTNVNVSTIGYAGRKLCKILCNNIVNNDYDIEEISSGYICGYKPNIHINDNILRNF